MTAAVPFDRAGILRSSARLLLLLVLPLILFRAAPVRAEGTRGPTVVNAAAIMTPAVALGKGVFVRADHAAAFDLRPGALEALRAGGSLRIENFPLADGGAVDLDLEEYSLFTPDARFVARRADGEVDVPAPAVRAYRGRVRGEMDSWAYIAVESGDLSGRLEHAGVEYNISTYGGHHADGTVTLNVFQPTAEMAAFECGTQDDEFVQDYLRGLELLAKRPALSKDTLEAKLAVDIDYQAFQHYGGTAKAESYVSARMVGVVAIYERDLAITIRISYMRTWETTDPYSPASDKAALNSFTDYWRDNMGAVDRTLATLISCKPISAPGVSQGLAWVNVLCSTTHGYAFVKFSNNDSWFSGHEGVWAHEVGHNFGSPHTHSCVWNPPIDSCYTAEPKQGQAPCFPSSSIHLILGGGELMSYCHMRYGNTNTHQVFRDRTGALVRSNAENASCMSTASTVRTLTLLTPQSGGQYCAGAVLDITWDAQGNNDLEIALSRDDGATYDTVLAVVPRTSRSWSWAVPNALPVASHYRIRVRDTKIPELVDAMTSSFSTLEGTVITSQVTWRNVCVGEGAHFAVTATGAGALTYQWKKNGTEIPGETKADLQLQNLQVSDNLSTFTCVVTGDCGPVESAPALLKVFTGAVILTDLENDTTCLGSSGEFRLEAEGSNLTYKWFFRNQSGQNRVIDVNSPVLTITNVKDADRGSYWCEVTSSCGKTTSKTKFLIVPVASVTSTTPAVWGQVIPTGGTFDIGWTQFCLTTVKIEYSLNGGSSWTTITGAHDAAAGYYHWTAPYTATDHGKFRISDAANPAAIFNESKEFVLRDLPVLTLSDTLIGFGWVGVGTPATRTLSVTNTGRAPMQVTAAAVVGSTAVTVSGPTLPVSLNPSESADLTLTFTPAVAEPLNARLRLSHSAGRDTLVALDGEGYVATAAGDAPAPRGLMLAPSYPNPLSAGSRAVIAYHLPAAADVTLSLHDALGREVRLLDAGRREAGTQRVALDAAGLAPGVYLYRLHTPAGSRTRTMQVVR